jgi:tRNA threonylcarbamoyl adenosine modification protein YeaZ
MNILSLSASMKNVILTMLLNEKIIKREISGTGSGSKILEKTEKILKENKMNLEDIKLFGIDIGPGSFTGIRISIAALQGLLFLRKYFEIRTFCSTDLINNSFYNFENIKKRAVLKKAREDFAYLSLYDERKRVFGPEMIEGKELKEMLENYVILGEESKHFIDKYNLSNKYYDVEISPESIIELSKNGRLEKLENLKPLYLQKPVAVESFEKKHNTIIDESHWS